MLMRLDEARDALRAALDAAIEDGDQRAEWVFNVNLANVENTLGDYASAERRFRRAAEIARVRANTSGTCTSLINLANVLSHLRRFDEAEEVAKEALRLTHEGRAAEARRLRAALVRSPDTDAQLRETLRTRARRRKKRHGRRGAGHRSRPRYRAGDPRGARG
jgi:tetratricopeptide (TPR) repeat protein